MNTAMTTFAVTTAICTGFGAITGVIDSIRYDGKLNKDVLKQNVTTGAIAGSIVGIVFGCVAALAVANQEHQNALIAQAQESLGDAGVSFTGLLIERLENEFGGDTAGMYFNWNKVWELAAQTAKDTGVEFTRAAAPTFAA